MNAITKPASLPTSPVALSVSLTRRVAWFRSKIETSTQGQSSICAADAPTADERAQLEIRSDDLARCLAPAGERAIEPHIASLMVSLRHSGEAPEDRAVLQRIWASDLADLPLFAIERACADFRQGRAGDGKWLPTQAEVRRVALTHADKYRKEQSDVRLVLGAVVSTPIAVESRERALAHWERVRGEIVANADPWAKDKGKPYSQITPTEAQAALDRMQSEDRAAPTLSDEALARFRGRSDV